MEDDYFSDVILVSSFNCAACGRSDPTDLDRLRGRLYCGIGCRKSGINTPNYQPGRVKIMALASGDVVALVGRRRRRGRRQRRQPTTRKPGSRTDEAKRKAQQKMREAARKKQEMKRRAEDKAREARRKAEEARREAERRRRTPPVVPQPGIPPGPVPPLEPVPPSPVPTPSPGPPPILPPEPTGPPGEEDLPEEMDPEDVVDEEEEEEEIPPEEVSLEALADSYLDDYDSLGDAAQQLSIACHGAEKELIDAYRCAEEYYIAWRKKGRKKKKNYRKRR